MGANITYPYEILKTEGNVTVFLTIEEYRNKFGENPDIVSYINIKHAIRVANQKLGLRLDCIPLSLPSQPPLIRLINYSIKGCNKWVKLAKRLDFCNANLMLRERKWELEVGAVQGINFWEKCYQLTRTIFYNNKIKWFHYQVVRGTLKTNPIIAKCYPNVTPNCSFWITSPETIAHLLYECFIVFDFLQDIYDFFVNGLKSQKYKAKKNSFLETYLRICGIILTCSHSMLNILSG